MSLNKKFICTLLVLFTFFFADAQTVNSWDKNAKDKKESWKFSNNLFQSYSIMPFLNFTSFDLKSEDNISSSAAHFDLFSLEYNFRYNLFNFRDFFSVSLSAYPSLGLDPNEGTLSTRIPYGLDLNFFNHSTYNNINKIGFTIGLGLSNNRISEDISWNSKYIRTVLKYDKYKRKLKQGITAAKLVTGFFGVHIGMGNSGDFRNKDIKSATEIRFVLGRAFGY